MARDLVRRFFEGDLATLRDDLFFPFQQAFDEVVDSFWSNGTLDSIKAKNGYPRMEVAVEGDEWVIRAAVPGVKLKDLLVEVIDDSRGKLANPHVPMGKITFSATNEERFILKVQGKMAEEYESPKDARYYCRELRKTAFTREILIPSNCEDKQSPKATLQDGILTLKWKITQGNQSNPNVTKVDIQ